MHLSSDVIPVAFSPGYEPRKRALTADELKKLLAELLADRAARVAFIVATSACWRETELARRSDVSKGLERCSPNDLRRTFASWQVEAGVPLFPIAQAMGHKDTRMLERVYGRQTPEQLAAIMARAMGLTQGVCSTFVAAPLDSAGSSGPDGLRATADSTEPESPKYSEAQRTLQSTGPRMFERVEVPGAGIEPATRGFSVPCSTD